VTRFIDRWRDAFGVEFVCATIGVPVSAYYERKSRTPSLRELQDRVLMARSTPRGRAIGVSTGYARRGGSSAAAASTWAAAASGG
jgi:hypothetical protein